MSEQFSLFQVKYDCSDGFSLLVMYISTPAIQLMTCRVSRHVLVDDVAIYGALFASFTVRFASFTALLKLAVDSCLIDLSGTLKCDTCLDDAKPVVVLLYKL